MKQMLLAVFAILLLTSCAGGPGTPSKEVKLTPASFNDLPGWKNDDLQGFTEALTRSCARILKQNPETAFGPIKEAGTYLDWQGICLDLRALQPQDARAFIERHFTPYAVNPGEKGLFTGYYEASLKRFTP
ncbi:MAG: MltA domain-containing protein [Alphaproteobacteria bacterium]|nr:MltA domain-containing protein [Alphaproteobacteria bacterium]